MYQDVEETLKDLEVGILGERVRGLGASLARSYEPLGLWEGLV